ncbi:pantoate--beta-alanine ligase [Clostridium sp. P21]|uniref:Pantothenate synthetase n=1 Tax=Clostridium muellerianum TaxID=2716538 RepID=A0A7Y0EE31_9CLOT|nr:pantoate--beta-alanine ligase [Clostridium muellerianum]NMM61673.1 pantoate--beta-alanine ligase [Clostridium muellerianum]
MKIVNNIKDLKSCIKLWKDSNCSIGLVPTMGYLHEGHKSLIDRACRENDKVVVSVFVNPTQFGANEDLDKYPRDIKRDSKLCEESGASLIFAPSPDEMYSKNFSTYINVENLTDGLCGSRRPGHFRGVCTVVSKLFNLITPNKAYFGEKDAQQLAVIKHMVEDLNFDVTIVGCPIIREYNGLAKSSRNTYLSKEEKKAALILNCSLGKAKKLLKSGLKDSNDLKSVITNSLRDEPLAKIDYVEIVDSISLKPVKKIENNVLIAIAVFIGKTRLIDNFTWNI